MTLSHGPVLSIAVSLCILLMSRPTHAEGERDTHTEIERHTERERERWRETEKRGRK